MSKKMINILAIVMAIAVAAMVWVQLITINKMVTLQENNFNSFVYRALLDVNEDLDVLEVNHFYELDSQFYLPDVKSSTGLNLYPNADPSESLMKLGRSGELAISYNRNSTKNSYIGLQISKTQTTTISSMQSSYNIRSEVQSRDLRFRSYMLEQSEKKIVDRI